MSVSGTKIPDKDKCKTCKGEKTVKESKMLEVNIEKGMEEGHKIVFGGEADQEVSEINKTFLSKNSL